MITMPSTLKKALAVGVMGVSMSMATMAGATDLNLVFLANEQDQEYDASLVFKNYVESRSDELNVNIFVGAQLCSSAPECFDAIQAGVVDMFTATAGGVAGVYPAIQGMDIPYAFVDDRVAKEILTDPQFNAFLRGEILAASGNNLRLMSMTQTGGWRSIANGTREVRKPSDLEGLRIRTIESQIQQQLVRAMGGSPTPLPWLEVYTGLQTGVVNGTLNSISDISNMNFQETINYLTLDNHAYMASMWFIGNQKFQSLTPEQRQIVADGAAMMSQVQFGIQPRKELDAYAKWLESGGQIYQPTEEEMEEFRALAAPIREWYIENFAEQGGDRFLEEFEAAQQRAIERVSLHRESAMN